MFYCKGMKFADVDGVVLRVFSDTDWDELRKEIATLPLKERWLFARGYNHDHPTTDFSRAALRTAREYGAELARKLQEQFPERRFVISYLEEQISFWQSAGEESEQDVPPGEPLPETAFCEACGLRQSYRVRFELDAEFPKANWGDCDTCGGELLLNTWEVRVPLVPLADGEAAL
ncbi:MAG: hypothetical protein OHK0029_01950 [Armatimonadaceae bacterium]